MGESIARPVGASMLALLCLLLSLLGFMAVLSLFLLPTGENPAEGLLIRGFAMFLLGAGFGAEAVGFWRIRPWVRDVVFSMFAVIVLASLLSAWGSGVVELGAVLVLGLAFAVNTVAIIYLKMPDIHLIFKAKS